MGSACAAGQMAADRDGRAGRADCTASRRPFGSGRMPLVELPLTFGAARPPADVRRFLREGERRIRRFQHARRVPAFVGSDFVSVYWALRGLEEAGQLGGRWFCEWGSGL